MQHYPTKRRGDLFILYKLEFVGATFGRLSNQNKPDKGHFVGDGVLDVPLQNVISFLWRAVGEGLCPLPLRN